MAKRLILNADDYGLTPDVNAAVDALFRGGYITSASLMPPACYAREALGSAIANGWDVGVHISFTGYPPKYGFPGVSGGRSFLNADGVMHLRPEDYYAAQNKEESLAELRAQVEWFYTNGGSPANIDSHAGTVYGIAGEPMLFETFGICMEKKLPFRLPRNLGFLKGYGGAVSASLAQFHAAAVAFCDQNGIGILDEMFTNHQPSAQIRDYEQLLQYYISVLDLVPDGVSELFMHPVTDTGAADADAFGAERRKRLWEFRILQDERFRSAITQRGIELVGWSHAFDE